MRSLRLHVRSWGEPTDPPVVMLHGGRDGSATFQFLVDALSGDWHVVAPDWRGHGGSGHAPEGYAFADYLADLDAILDQLFGDRPVPLVGHSLGGNVACIYAGIRPERVSHLVSLDGFGLPDRSPDKAPDTLRRWLDGWRDPPAPRGYAALAGMAARLRQANPRLDAGRALFLAENLSRPAPGGGLTWAFDPLHRLPFATLHRVAEWAACLRRISAPVQWIGSGAVFPPALAHEEGGFEWRVELARAEFHRVPGTGHNLHHDAPDAVAALVEPFLRRAPPSRQLRDLD